MRFCRTAQGKPRSHVQVSTGDGPVPLPFNGAIGRHRGKPLRKYSRAGLIAGELKSSFGNRGMVVVAAGRAKHEDRRPAKDGHRDLAHMANLGMSPGPTRGYNGQASTHRQKLNSSCKASGFGRAAGAPRASSNWPRAGPPAQSVPRSAADAEEMLGPLERNPIPNWMRFASRLFRSRLDPGGTSPPHS